MIYSERKLYMNITDIWDLENSIEEQNFQDKDYNFYTVDISKPMHSI